MNDHVINPRRTGRDLYCVTLVDQPDGGDKKPCGRDVQYVRHRVRRPFWRHTSGRALANLSRANRDRQIDAGNW